LVRFEMFVSFFFICFKGREKGSFSHDFGKRKAAFPVKKMD
jgi:hypothetical protein